MTNLKIKRCGIVQIHISLINYEIINYWSNNILLCKLYHIYCTWTVNKITNIPLHRYQSYKEMNVFLIMSFKILIVVTLRTFASNLFYNLTPIILIDINFLFVLQNFTLKSPFFTRPGIIWMYLFYCYEKNCRLIGNTCYFWLYRL